MSIVVWLRRLVRSVWGGAGPERQALRDEIRESQTALTVVRRRKRGAPPSSPTPPRSVVGT